jgi:hypothetical protein
MEKSKRMKKKIIVTACSNDMKYINGQKRLTESYWLHHTMESSVDGIMYSAFQSESDLGSPSHQENPYAFKVYAIEKMKELGYDQILWLDSSIIFVKHAKPIFDWIEDRGFFFEEAGHWTGSWCNERTLEYFNITRQEAMEMPMFSAGFTGLDFTNPKSVEFFNRWKQSMLDGQFIGDWSNHRHDMTCASIIANQMDMVKSYSSGGNYFAYIGGGYSQPKESVVCHLIGL